MAVKPAGELPAGFPLLFSLSGAPPVGLFSNLINRRGAKDAEPRSLDGFHDWTPRAIPSTA
jgi:hypothetical protein